MTNCVHFLASTATTRCASISGSGGIRPARYDMTQQHTRTAQATDGDLELTLALSLALLICSLSDLQKPDLRLITFPQRPTPSVASRPSLPPLASPLSVCLRMLSTVSSFAVARALLFIALLFHTPVRPSFTDPLARAVSTRRRRHASERSAPRDVAAHLISFNLI